MAIADKKIRFIHIKKNGGTSVYKFLRKNGVKFVCGHSQDGFKIANQHVPASRYKNEDSWKFCVVRNPFSRVVSFYNWMLRLPNYRNTNFEDFVRNKFERGRAKGVWDLQLDYIMDDQDNCLVDKIFRFEDMENEIKTYFNIESKFPFLNRSTDGDYRNFYTEELANIVYDRLKKDFEYFNYDHTRI